MPLRELTRQTEPVVCRLFLSSEFPRTAFLFKSSWQKTSCQPSTSSLKSDLAAPFAPCFHVFLNLPTFICLCQERRRVCSSVPFPGRPSAAAWGSSRSSSRWAATASCCSSPHLQVCITPQHSEGVTRARTEAIPKLPRACTRQFCFSLLSASTHKRREIFSLVKFSKQRLKFKILCQSLWPVTYCVLINLWSNTETDQNNTASKKKKGEKNNRYKAQPCFYSGLEFKEYTLS